MTPRVNKWLDLVDRCGWTAVQASAGAFIAWSLTDQVGWAAALSFVGGATLVSVCKVIVGQNTGSDDTGALIGTPVIEPPPLSPPSP